MKPSIIPYLKLSTTLLIIILSLTFSNAYTYASKLDTAEELVTHISNEILFLATKNTDLSSKQKSLEVLFNNFADVNTIARAALGKSWRNLDEKSKRNFIDAFQKYIAKKYSSQFKEFTGAKMKIEKSIDYERRGVLVKTRLIMSGSSPISVNWQLWSRDGSLKLIDIIIEGISMLTIEREEIKNRLNKLDGNTLALIQDLKNY